MKEYIQGIDFSKKFDKICEKLKGKTVVIYGAGIVFGEIRKRCDLSKINIIGIIDKKFPIEQENESFFGLKIIPYVKMCDIECDAILIAIEQFKPVKKKLKSIYPKKKIISLVENKEKKNLAYYLNKIKFINDYKRNKTNKIVLIKANGKKIYNPKIKNLKVEFSGKNNYLEIHEPFNIEDEVIILGGSDNRIIIGANNEHRYTKIIMGNKNILEIGKNTTTVGLSIHMFSAQNRKISIGDDCQFAWSIILRTADAHTIYDIKTKEIINPAKDVYIGNHVWIATGVTVLKGSYIASNSMVGTCSIVNKEFKEENCIIAGSPAKVIKRGINWDRRGVADFSK